MEKKTFTEDELQALAIPKLSIWKHYTGGNYRVLEVGLAEGTKEVVVVYQRTLGGSVWVRRLTEWLGTVEHGGQTVNRYSQLKPG